LVALQHPYPQAAPRRPPSTGQPDRSTADHDGIQGIAIAIACAPSLQGHDDPIGTMLIVLAIARHGGRPPSGGRFRATIPAPALPGSGSDGRRPDAALSAPAHGAPVVPPWDPGALLRAALAGGADIVQLREKRAAGDRELLEAARPFRQAADEHGALFILNDRPDLVAACEADGVHVGQDDTPVAEARRLAGSEALVGLSTHSRQQVEAACAAQGDARPDQISVGPVWETPTKQGRAGTGLDPIRYAADSASLPWFAIGGIDPSNVGEVVAAGAERIVVVRAIRDAPDPEATARLLREALEGAAARP
jgi:thiamine-phosphate pyrophosphorylase